MGITYFWSASMHGFFTSDIHGTNIPEDSVEITEEYWSELLNGQSYDKTITSDADGRPCLVDFVPVEDPEFAQRQASKESAIKKLKALGLTDEELTAMLNP